MSKIYEIEFNANDISKCRHFAIECAKYKSENFGTSYEDNVKYIFIGKLGEIAFAKFLKSRFGISVALDMETYVGHDSGDIIYKGKSNGSSYPWIIDVKTVFGNTDYGRISISKVANRSIDNKIAHYFFYCKLINYKNKQGKFVYKAQIEGYLSLDELIDADSGMSKIFLVGDDFNGKESTKDVFAIDIKKLHTDWEELISFLDINKPKYINQLDVRRKVLLRLSEL